MNSPFDNNTKSLKLEDVKKEEPKLDPERIYELADIENLQEKKTEITWLSYDLYSEARPLSRQG